MPWWRDTVQFDAWSYSWKLADWNDSFLLVNWTHTRRGGRVSEWVKQTEHFSPRKRKWRAFFWGDVWNPNICYSARMVRSDISIRFQFHSLSQKQRVFRINVEIFRIETLLTLGTEYGASPALLVLASLPETRLESELFILAPFFPKKTWSIVQWDFAKNW